MNEIKLHGRIGKEPEIDEKQGQNGPFKVATFSFAVDRYYGDKVDWFRCEAIGKLAETIQNYGYKGKPLYIQGSMESYKTDRDEFVHWKVKVQRIEFELGDKKEASTNGNPTSTASTETSMKDSFEQIDTDVPF